MTHAQSLPPFCYICDRKITSQHKPMGTIMSRREMGLSFGLHNNCIYELLGQPSDATGYWDTWRHMYCTGRPNRREYILGQGDNLHHHYHLQEQRTEQIAKKINRKWYSAFRLCFCIRKLGAADKTLVKLYTKLQ